MLNKEDIKIILDIIRIAPIKGSEAIIVANLIQKLNFILQQSQQPKEAPKEENKENKEVKK
jgi:hypothetical protein